MTADPRAALTRLVTALERHLEAASDRRGEDDPAVLAAYDDVADAFEAYDAALFDAYGEVTPMDLLDEEDLEDDEDDDEDPEDDLDQDDGDPEHAYFGLGDEDDIEVETRRDED